MKIFACYKHRTKKCEVLWESLSQTLASKFGLDKSRFLVELKTSDFNGQGIWVELEDENDMTEGCMVRLVESEAP